MDRVVNIRRALVFAAFVAQSVSACELCAIYSATQARGEGQGFFLGAAEQFTHYGTIQVDGEEVPNVADQRLDSSVSQVFLGYNVTRRFGVQFNAPLIYRSFRRTEGLGIQEGTVSGLGDVSLIGSFEAYRHGGRDWELQWHIIGGVKFPTGNTSRLAEELQEGEPAPGEIPSAIHGHDLTLGSGSYDGVAGSVLYARWKRLFFSGELQYAIRSEGDYGYRFADDLTWSGGPGVLAILEDNYSLSLQFNVGVEKKGQDTLQGARMEDTGLTAVYLGPQFVVTWKEHLSGELGLDLPVLRENTALQAVADYRVRAAVTWRF